MFTTEVDGIELTVARVAGVGGSAPASRVSANVASSFRLELLPSGIATRIGRVLGGQDVKVGDASFDAAFMIKADDEGLARAWLTARVRRALLATEGYRFELAGGELVAVCHRHDDVTGVVQSVLVAMAALAGTSRALMLGWRSAAAALGAVAPAGDDFPSSGLSLDWVSGGGLPLRVECGREARSGARWYLRVRAAMAARGDGLRFSVTPQTSAGAAKVVLDAAPAHEEAARSLLTGTVKRALFRARATAGMDDRGAVVEWEGVEPELDRLQHAVALVSEWAQVGGAAPYR